METILAIDDEKEQLNILDQLLNQDYKFYGFQEANTIFDQINNYQPDLILLDKHLDGKTSIDVIEKIRHSEHSNIPIVMITGDSNDASLEEAIDCGADDFISKPFTLKQLKSRLKASLRRTGSISQHSHLLFKGLSIDKQNKNVLHNGKVISLTEIERQILTLLVTRAKSAVGREELFDYCTIKGNTKEVSLNVHVCTLRKKLKLCGIAIKTIRNEGYILA